MQHPIHEIGEKRICPVTGRVFGESWDNPAIRPFTHWNVCDSCEPHSREAEPETTHQKIGRLNREYHERFA